MIRVASVVLVEDEIVFVDWIWISNASMFVFMRYLSSTKVFISILLGNLSRYTHTLLLILVLILFQFSFEALPSDVGRFSPPTFFLCFDDQFF